VLRDPRVEAAIVTNVSADHVGEYGIHDLAALADVKLTVGAAVAQGGLLVLPVHGLDARTEVLSMLRGRC
jgi:UDP-N-acetylmuramate-alanine ligase